MNSQPSYFLASFPELPDYGVRLERLSDDWIAIEMYESYAGTEIGRTAVKVGELSLAIALMRVAASLVESKLSTCFSD